MLLVISAVLLVVAVIVALVVAEFQDPTKTPQTRQDTLLSVITAIPVVAGLICDFIARGHYRGGGLVAIYLIGSIQVIFLLALLVITWAETMRFRSRVST